MTDQVNIPDHKVNWDFSQIGEYIYLGADMCCGGDHYEYLIKDMGIKADIALAEEKIETPSNLLDIFLWLPIVDRTAPSIEQMDAAVGVIHAAVSNKKKIFIHCRLGHGRGPTILAAYYISLGKSVDEAVSIIKEARPEIHPNEPQITILNRYFKKNSQK